MDFEVIRVLVETSLWVIGGLVGVLCVLVGWIGSRVHNRLDSMAKSLVEIKDDLKQELAIQKDELALQRSELNVQKERIAMLYSLRRKTDFAEGGESCSH